MTPIAIKKLIVNKNMKHYNFDEVIERHGTSCVKFDRLKEMFGDTTMGGGYGFPHTGLYCRGPEETL